MRSELGAKITVEEGWEKVPEGTEHLDVADVTIDPQGQVVVVTRDVAQVLVYDRDGTFVSSWGLGLVGTRPHAITAGPDGRLYVVDETGHTVKIFTADGKQIGLIGNSGVESDTGIDWSAGSFKSIEASVVRAAGPFNHPTKVAVAPSGDLYVSDGYGNARVHRFTAAGELIQSWGEPGTGPGQFRVPHAVAGLRDQRVIVADREGDRLQLFSLEGKFIDEWTDVQRPTAITQDARGWIYVTELPWHVGDYSWRAGDIADPKPARLTIFDTDGAVIARAATDGDHALPGNLAAPHGIAVDAEGSIYIAEVTHAFLGNRGLAPPDCHTLQKFRLG